MTKLQRTMLAKLRALSCSPILQLRLWLLIALSSVPFALPAAEPASPVTLEGTFVMQVADDFEHGRSRTLHLLRERRSNELVELQLSPQQAKQIRPGQQLRVSGRRSGKVLAADSGVDSVAVLTEAASLAPANGIRRVINIIIDITDGTGVTHAINGECDGTEKILAGEMFGVRGYSRYVDGCFRESSNELVAFGGASYPGTATDVVRVAITEPSPSLASICPYDAWAASADAAAIARGVDLSAYQHRMYVLPMTTSGCWWAGLAYVGCGESCQAWVRSYTDNQHSTGPCGLRDAMAHELGHNLGTWHARTDSNNDGISDCEYCDTTDIMGYALDALRGFNAPRRDRMGWLGADQIVDGASGGVFTISALGMQNSPYPQVVKIVPPSGWPYWLSYRARLGYDTGIESYHFDKLHVHRADESGFSYLITELADGATHVDANLNLTVRQLSHTADSATLEVQFEAAYNLSASSLMFGNQPLNVTSSAQTITVLSTGGKPLPITSIVIGGTHSGEFSQTNNCGTSLAPGASCAIEVTFKPISTGSKVATLSVTAGGGAGTKVASLSGTGAASTFTLSPNWLGFGLQTVGVTSAAQTIILRSAGIRPLPITSIVIDGTHPGEFAQTNNCGTSLAVGASCAINVTFKPTNGAGFSATLSVTGGNGAGTKSADLSGNGVKSAYTLSPASLAFGNQPLNLASNAKTIIVRNTDATPMPIMSIRFGGTNPLLFTQTNDCGAMVAGGASCAIKVRFKPTSTGSKVATLNVIAGGRKMSATLSGTGTRSTFSISTTALSFGNVTRNHSSTAKSVRISNTGGVVLPISSIDLAGTNPGQFARTHNCPARVAVGGSCTVNVVFKPTSTGAKSAVLMITPGGGAAPRSVALRGTGI